MTREYIKIMLPIIQAFTEGKAVEYLNDEKGWIECSNPHFWEDPKHYRIKPESKYRSFKSRDECWNEMMKHKLFGWITNKSQYLHIACVRQWNIECIPDTGSGVLYSRTLTFAEALEQGYTFADGTPFGTKED